MKIIVTGGAGFIGGNFVHYMVVVSYTHLDVYKRQLLALDGTEDGLQFYRRIASGAGAHLSDGGHLYLEIGYDQGAAVKELLEEAGFQKVRVYRDLPGKDRVVSAVWPGTRQEHVDTGE